MERKIKSLFLKVTMPKNNLNCYNLDIPSNLDA